MLAYWSPVSAKECVVAHLLEPGELTALCGHVFEGREWALEVRWYEPSGDEECENVCARCLVEARA